MNPSAGQQHYADGCEQAAFELGDEPDEPPVVPVKARLLTSLLHP